MRNSQIQQLFVGNQIHKRLLLHSLCVIVALIVLVSGFFIGSSAGSLFDGQASLTITGIRIQDGSLKGSGDPTFQTVQLTEASVVELYQAVQDSVVTVTAQRLQESDFGNEFGFAQGSGFVYSFNNRMVIITNFHVINQAIEISVTFADGNGYAADLLGSDPYADLAILEVDAPENQFEPLQIVSSSSLRVGDFVVAVGSPFGLSGSMTTGIVSQLGRTVTSPVAGNYLVANVIQTDAPINPGNSGGPLLNDQGQVIGINTATVSESTGIGFAVPSNTILREINDLVNTGSYNKHPYLGISSVDMNYYIAQEMGIDITYGVLLQQVTRNGPADQAGLRVGDTQVTINGATLAIGGDIIIAINGDTIINTDALSAYLEENTQPNQQITISIVRNSQTQNVPLTLGTRPPPDASAIPTLAPSPSPTIPEATPLIVALAMITLAVVAIIFAKKKKPKSSLLIKN